MPAPMPTRRAAREAAAALRRARVRRARRIRAWFGIAAAAALVVGGATAVTAALTGSAVDDGDVLAGVHSTPTAAPASPAPAPTGSTDPTDAADEPTPPAQPTEPAELAEPTEPARGVCDDPAVIAALKKGPDDGVIAAVGGGEAFRAAVVSGDAPCLSLSDADRIWVVVNKRHPLDPIDYWPGSLAQAAGVQRTSGGHMRADVADALSDLAAASADEGAGAIGVNSGFRPYDYQVSTYNGYVNSLGRAAADRRSARPGHSEHQTGLAVDVVACTGGCGGLDGFGATRQARWVAENAWRFGFVVRYEDGRTSTTGYQYEPWHLRYIGVDLAEAYHDGGFHTLEEFFGLGAASDYE